MRKLLIALTLLSIAFGAFAADQSSAEDKARAVQLTKQLESDPLARDAKNARQWLTIFLGKAPDIEVDLCGAFIHDVLADKKYKYTGEIITQSMFAQGAYTIEHPDISAKADETFLAGLQSALKVYEAILAKDPKARRADLDALIASRDKNELTAYVQAHSAECRK